MSKFYYSGSLEQVNFLSQKDIFIQFLYGNWISMFFEGTIFIIYALLIVGFEFVQYFKLYTFPEYIVVYGFIGLCLILALTFLITYYWSKKHGIVNILKQRAILDLSIAVVLFIFPFFLNGIVGFSSCILGLYFIENKKNPRKVLGTLFILIGILLIFNIKLPFSYINFLYVILLMGFGIYLIQLSVKFHSSVKKFEDEQKGFTDYKIE